MTKKIRCSALRNLIVLSVFVLSIGDGRAQSPPRPPRAAASSPSDLAWPPITNQSKPWTRWWWLGSTADKREMTAEMEKYKDAGLGGLEITPIYGVRGEEHRFTRFLSPQWMDLLDHALKEGARLELGIDMANGTGWPFGGPWVGADEACRNIVHKIYRVKGGERLNEAIRYVQKPLVRAVGRRVGVTEISEPLFANKNLQALALDQVKFEKALPLQVLMAYSDRGEVLNLTGKVGKNGTLDWVAPAGNWVLYAAFQGWHGKLVERAGPGGEGNVIDHFSEQALSNYLREFERAYANRPPIRLRAYFNDSYEVDDAQGEADWTPRFFEEFRTRRGYDLREHLPALFGADTAEKNSRVLTDYRETISDLLLEKFTIPWRAWAAAKGAIIRNQAHGSPANILDLYAASDIPETEGTDILRMKFATSAAHVSGRTLASSESATWLSEHFLSTLGDVKQAVDWFFLGGVNHIFYHGTPFSPATEEWPGWLFYAAVHFGPTNSFWIDFPALNRYVARTQSFLQSARPAHDVLLYYPIYDLWSERGTSLLQHFGGGVDATMTQGDAKAMLADGYTFDFISDRQLAAVTSTGGRLHTGGLVYKTLVLPQSRLMPPETFARVIELARRGATIVVHTSLPSDVPGWGGLGKRRQALQKLTADLRFVDVGGGAGVRSAKIGRGQLLLGDDLRQLLSQAGVEREEMVDKGLEFTRRRHAQGHYYFVLNGGSAPFDGWVSVRAGEKSAAIFNSMTERAGLAALRASSTGAREIYLQLAPGESCIVKTSETMMNGPSYEYVRAARGAAAPPLRQIRGNWFVNFTAGGPEISPPVEVRDLGSWTEYGGEAVKRFSGTARYTTSFALPERNSSAGWLLDLGRVAESARVKLNGRELGTLIQPPYRVSIPAGVLRETNTLEVSVSNLMANRIADLDRRGVNWKKFYNINFPARSKGNSGADNLFTAAHWPPRDSGLIGPVTLAPIEFFTPER